MPNLLDNSTSTDITSGRYLPPGKYKLLLETANASASISVYTRKEGNTVNMPVTQSGSAIALTPTDPSKIVESGGEEFLVQNADGSSAATVSATALDT